MGDIECLGKTYKSEFKEAIEKIKEKIKTDQTKLNNYKLTVCVYKSDCIEKKERFEKLKKGEYTNLVLVEEDGFIKLSVDGVNLGIDHKCYAAGNLKQRIGQAVIINKKNPPSASSINIYVDIN